MRKIVVIQCAGSKKQESWTWHGRRLIFVANKMKYQLSHPDLDVVPYEPDNFVPGSSDLTWRRAFLEYYQTKRKPRVLLDADDPLEAWQLYSHSIYKKLVQDPQFGKENVFILSAGWGLVNADYRLPAYNITLGSSTKQPYAVTSCGRLWEELETLNYNPLRNVDNEAATVYFFGGAKYRDLLYRYTDNIPGTKIIYHRGEVKPKGWRQRPPEYVFAPYVPKKPKLKTNWHYECAERFIEGELNV